MVSSKSGAVSPSFLPLGVCSNCAPGGVGSCFFRLPREVSCRCDSAHSIPTLVVWNSILASTRQSYKTHVRSWLRFCSETLGKDSEQFVIEFEEVTLWSCNFSNVGTFKNYLAGLQWSCDLLGVPTAVFADPLIRSCCVSWHCILRR